MASRRRPTCCSPSSWRAGQDFGDWLTARGIIVITGVDTRALSALIREKGMPHGVIAHDPDGRFDLEALIAEARQGICTICHVRLRPQFVQRGLRLADAGVGVAEEDRIAQRRLVRQLGNRPRDQFREMG